MKLTTTDILAVPCEVHVSTGGLFEVYLAGHAPAENESELERDDRTRALANSRTYEDVIEKAKPAVRARKIKVSVPFVTGSHEAGIATGFHAGTGNVLATIGGESVQVSMSYGARTYYSGHTPEDVLNDMRRLEDEIRDRENKLKALRKTWTIDLDADVRAAIEQSDAVPA